MLQERIVEHILDRLVGLEHWQVEHLSPYEEFTIDGSTYYFTPGGLLYKKEQGRRGGGFFCGYLSDEVWHFRTDDS